MVFVYLPFFFSPKSIAVKSFQSFITIVAIALFFLSASGCGTMKVPMTAQDFISPNQFQGTDTERIQSAVDYAHQYDLPVRIPRANSNGSRIWMIDEAILLPSHIQIILDNCTLQLSDQSRDNMFRSNNVGQGIKDPQWLHGISITGKGHVMLRGADHPRSTGDGGRTLTLDPQKEQEAGHWRVSYGSDAGKEGVRQKGDWRNIMILMAFVDGFSLENVHIENAHAWSVSFERVHNARLSDIRIHNIEYVVVDGVQRMTSNKDGINLRQGCKNFTIHNITGQTGDDFIALSSLDTRPDQPKEHGDISSTMVTASRYYGPDDDIENISISNIRCSNRYRAIAIRASDRARIHHVYIDGLVFNAIEDRYDAVLLGGKGYGKMNITGGISDIHIMNVVGNGKSLVRIEAPVRNCYFMNGIYTGSNENPTLYTIESSEVEGIREINWKKF